jgi:hypothetical protein
LALASWEDLAVTNKEKSQIKLRRLLANNLKKADKPSPEVSAISKFKLVSLKNKNNGGLTHH